MTQSFSTRFDTPVLLLCRQMPLEFTHNSKNHSRKISNENHVFRCKQSIFCGVTFNTNIERIRNILCDRMYKKLVITPIHERSKQKHLYFGLMKWQIQSNRAIEMYSKRMEERCGHLIRASNQQQLQILLDIATIQSYIPI